MVAKAHQSHWEGWKETGREITVVTDFSGALNKAIKTVFGEMGTPVGCEVNAN